jgi:hypothetical protein
MKPAVPLALAIALSLPAAAAFSEPFCGAFLNPDAMPAKYARLAPVLSDRRSGWIFTQDQLDADYRLKSRPKALLAEIAGAFDDLGIRLAILMPPPRPLAAGQKVLDAASGGLHDLNVAAVSASYSAMAADVRTTGILMPDLSRLASEPGPAAYYFRRDTHWTPYGAALSARALAAAATGDVPEEPALAEDRYKEPGSLAAMARAACGTASEPETVPFAEIPGAGGSLLGINAPELKAVLAGSSFSDRYKKDAYRVADALAAYLQADVANFSVSGGGPIGAIESLIASGHLDGGRFDLLVWELPYTEGLNNESALRQLLGALQLRYGREAEAAVLEPGIPLEINAETGLPIVLRLEGLDKGQERHTVEIRYKDRKPSRIKLVRKARIPHELRQGPWAASLTALPSQQVQEIVLR